MTEWYRVADRGDRLRVELVRPEHGYLTPEEVAAVPLPAVAAGRRVELTGPTAVWVYAHAAAALRAAGAEVDIDAPHRDGTSDDLDGSRCELEVDAERRGLLTLHFRKRPGLTPAAVARLLARARAELERERPGEVCLTGQATVGAYADLAAAAVDVGVRRLACLSARDGVVEVFPLVQGGISASWVARFMPPPERPLIVGVVGDPNCGKSVFSRALADHRESAGCPGWLLDCDAQAPTAPWYLSLVGEEPEQARSLRDASKRDWTPEMEARVVGHLRHARRLFDVLIADLPGGQHKVPPVRRVPPGRERMMAEVDAFLVLDRDGRTEASWREALGEHGLDRRVAAVIQSRDPKSAPALSVVHDGDTWRGTARGLDRGHDNLLPALRAGLDALWPALLEHARRRPPA